MTPAELPVGRRLRALDAAIAVWCAAWLLLALQVGREVRALGGVATSAVAAAEALEQAGDALTSLGDVPLLGAQVVEVGERMRAAGASARAGGRASRESVEDLSLLLALAIGLVPTLPILALYLPLRAGARREARTIRALIRTQGLTPDLEELLARRAVDRLPYERLLAITPTPARDLAEGRHAALAHAELERLGLPLPRPRPVRGGRA